ncbi:MAG: AgmX/PglI C-terminal domain-containing protein [Pseudomonadota bacterium]
MKKHEMMMPGAMPMMEERKEPASAARFIDLDKIEDRDAHVIEVIAVWKNTVFNVKHLGAKKPVFTVGEEPDCDYWIPSYQLAGSSKVVLADARGSLHLSPIFSGGEVEMESGGKKPLEALLEKGTRHVTVPPGGKCSVEIGDTTFIVRSVPKPKRPAFPLTFDWAKQSFTGLSFMFHVAFLFLVFFVAPSSRWLSADQIGEFDNAYIRYLLRPTEIVPDDQLPDWMKKQEKDEGPMSDPGKAHKGEAGKMGDLKAKKTDNRYGIKGDGKEMHMAKDQKEDLVREAGIVAVLSQTLNMPTSPFGQNTANGNDLENALGALVGNDIGPNFGFGGLSMYGTGRYGAGTGEGTIGVGPLGTIGSIGGPGPIGDHWKPLNSKLGPKPDGKGPVVTPKGGTVIGTLPKDAIRRVIRQHLNEVRYCYEQQLAVKTDLSGRVVIKFVIMANGVVQGSLVQESTLGSKPAEQCIAKAVGRWTFPAPPDGGVVIVSYPFILQPAAGM